MFRALVFSAVAAGLIGGLTVSVFQWAVVTPLILEAEVFERGVAAAADSAAGFDLSRTLITGLASAVYASGLALVLLGVMLLGGIRITAHSALAWGVAGFFAIALAPALGLPPVVPGIPEPPLMDRQIWWSGTVLATAFGLWAILQRRSSVWIAIGIVSILAPHVIGAPHMEAGPTEVPATIAAHFVSASLVASLLLWVSISALSGFAFDRLAVAEK